MWARALGGFADMHVALQRQLLILEEKDNPLYTFLERPVPDGGFTWVHVDECHPGGYLPDYTTWRVMCSGIRRSGGAYDEVRAMARGIRELFERENRQANLMSGRIQVHAAALANASDSKDDVSQLEVHTERRLRAIRLWSINQWRHALSTEYGVLIF